MNLWLSRYIRKLVDALTFEEKAQYLKAIGYDLDTVTAQELAFLSRLLGIPEDDLALLLV